MKLSGNGRFCLSLVYGRNRSAQPLGSTFNFGASFLLRDPNGKYSIGLLGNLLVPSDNKKAGGVNEVSSSFFI